MEDSKTVNLTVSPKLTKAKPKVTTISLFSHDGGELTDLLKGVKPISGDRLQSGSQESTAVSATAKLAALQVSSAMSCTFCGITFDTRDEQTEHFKGDWHRFNIKRRLHGYNSVTETAFIEMADSISSLSCSDFSESDTEEKLTVAKVKHKKTTMMPVLEGSESSEDEFDGVMMASKRIQIYMQTSSGHVLAMYRPVLFHKKEHPDNVSDIVDRIEQALSHNIWLIIMMGGGHFAAAVFENGNVSAHKTFHRYVVRAKCGTSQSQHDKKGGHAQSAGAQIRRHNEVALAQDIEELLVSWRSYIDKCHRIFLRIGTHNYPYIFNKKNKLLLDKHDSRIRMIPFPTKRATFSEVKRVFTELSSLKVLDQKPSVLEKTKKKLVSKRGPSLERRRRQGHPTDEINADAECKLPSEEEVEDSVVLVDTAHADDLKGETIKHRKSVKEKDLSVPAQNKMLAFQSEFYTACTVGDKVELERLVTGYSNEILQGLDNFSAAISLPLNSQGHTLLHIACQKCHSHLIPYLLGIGCDPAKPDEKNVVPYLSTQNKAVRNEFRIFMESFPEKYDYIKAQVPGPLTREMVALKDSKDSERRKELNKKKKDRLKVKKAEAAAQRAEDEEKARFLALSDREKRALAAERRLLQAAGTQSKVPQVLNRCHHCAKDITGKTPFEYLNYTFCSPQCLKLHRQAQKGS